MVRAILDGRKNVTRRVVKPQPIYECSHDSDHEFVPDNFMDGKVTGFVCRKCGYGVCPPHSKYPVGEASYRPYCWPGCTLYVRETWAIIGTDGTHHKYGYKADNERLVPLWRPSIHMPKEAARIFLQVTEVRLERLYDMEPYDIAFEGFRRQRDFIALWDSTIKKSDLLRYGWAANPWVWVIAFERISKEEALSTDEGA